jgi:hypothetical protein
VLDVDGDDQGGRQGLQRLRQGGHVLGAVLEAEAADQAVGQEPRRAVEAGGAPKGLVVHEDGDAVERALDIDLDAVSAQFGRFPDALQAVFGGVSGAGAVGDDHGGHVG